MSLHVVGINHRTAPVDVRERVVFELHGLRDALRELLGLAHLREAVIVSTCNRTELYFVLDGDPAEADVGGWLARYHGLGAGIQDSLYRLDEHTAVAHAFSVAAGLDSMVLGEPQILGQLKEAYRVAHESGSTGPVLNRLFQAAFSVAKRVRTETGIGANAVSVASAAVAMTHTVFAGLEQRTALLIGAGATAALAARHLRAEGLRRMIIANRSIDAARELAAEFQAFAIGLEDVGMHLPDADIVLASTASSAPILTRGTVEAAIVARRRRPMLILDIAVPRDIDPAVAGLEDVYLFTIDDLHSVVADNLEGRRQAAVEADVLIGEEVARFEAEQRTRDAGPAIRQLRDAAERARRQTLEQAERMLANGQPPAEVLAFLATTLTNRLLHAPCVRLREAAQSGDAPTIDAIAAIFGAGPER
jgi:glutamyl-tRNA reductase